MGHVSMVWFVHSAQFRFGSVVGEYIYIYIVVSHELGIEEFEGLCDLCICDAMCCLGVTSEFVVNFFVGDPIVYICKFSVCKLSYDFMCRLLMYVCRVRISPLCSPIVIPLSQYGMLCVVYMWCWRGFGVGLGRVVP